MYNSWTYICILFDRFPWNGWTDRAKQNLRQRPKGKFCLEKCRTLELIILLHKQKNPQKFYNSLKVCSRFLKFWFHIKKMKLNGILRILVTLPAHERKTTVWKCPNQFQFILFIFVHWARSLHRKWSCISRTLGDDMLAARCLVLNSYLIDISPYISRPI